MFLLTKRFISRSCAALAVMAIAGFSAQAQNILFADNFDRADATDIDSAASGMSGVLVGTVLNPPGGVWLEPVDAYTALETRSAVVANELNIANGSGTSHVVLDYNLASDFALLGDVRVSFEAVAVDPGSDAPEHRYVGIGLGGTIASVDVTGDRIPSRVADLFVAVDRTGHVRINDEDPALRPGSGDILPTISLDVDPDSADVFVPGTVHIDLSFADTLAGTEVTYDVSFDDGDGEVDILPGVRTFAWTHTDEVALSLAGRAVDTGVVMDNLSIGSGNCVGAPVQQALVASNGNELLLYSVDGGVWTPEGTFLSGSVFGQNLNVMPFAQDSNTGDIFVFENRGENNAPNRVLRFDKSGWPLEIIGTQEVDFTGSPFFGALAPNGDLIFTTQPFSATPAKVVKYEAATGVWIDPFIPNQYTTGDTLVHLRGVTATPDGRVFICDRDDDVNSVLEFDQFTGAFVGVAYSATRAQAIEYDAVCDRLLLTVNAASDDEVLEFSNMGTPWATNFDFGAATTLFSSAGSVALGIHSFISLGSELYVAPFQQDEISLIEGPSTITPLVSVTNPTYLRNVSVTTGGRYDLNYDNELYVEDMLLAMENVGGPGNPMPSTGDPIEFDKLDSDEDGDVDMPDYMLASAAFNSVNEPPFQATGPNVIVILLDDLGYSDLGCYGSEVHTPTIDSLAANGLRFRNFYNAARCAPTRCAILTGQYTQRVAVDPGASLPNLRTDNNVTIAEALGAAGYRCYMSGKWHLGHPSTGRDPLSRGFEHVFGFGNDVSGANVNTYWDINLYNMISTGNEVPPIDYSGTQFYQTDAIGDYSVRFIQHHNSQGDNKPFFLYMAFNATHWPIEAPADMADHYTDVGDDDPSDVDYYHYEDGYEVTRLDRYNRQLALGAIDARYALTPRRDHPAPPTAIPDWNTLSQDRRNDMARRMAVWAAMLERLDMNIKKVIDLLEQTGQLDDTLILLCADNGANYEGGLFGDDGDSYSPRSNYNDLRSMGQPGDKAIFGRVDIGGAWANVSNTPFKLFKHFTHNGGIGSPAIIHWPNGMDPNVMGTWTEERGHLIDFLPTILDVSGAPYPTVFEGHPVNPLDGTSLAPLLSGHPLAPRDLVVEHESNRAIYRGNYKFVTKNFAYTDGSSPANELELYDLSVDPSEYNNIATTNPTTLQELIDAWNAWAEDVGVPSGRWLP